MTSLAAHAGQLSSQAREVLARELIRAGTVFPVDTVAERVAGVLTMSRQACKCRCGSR